MRLVNDESATRNLLHNISNIWELCFEVFFQGFVIGLQSINISNDARSSGEDVTQSRQKYYPRIAEKACASPRRTNYPVKLSITTGHITPDKGGYEGQLKMLGLL